MIIMIMIMMIMMIMIMIIIMIMMMMIIIIIMIIMIIIIIISIIIIVLLKTYLATIEGTNCDTIALACGRHLGAKSIAIVRPSVIGALHLPVHYLAQRERTRSMGTRVRHA
jgi:hypothetical protein